MKTWKRWLSALLVLVLALTPVLSMPVAAEEEATEANTLYVYDLEAFLETLPGTRIQYDYLKFATALQGLANRERPQLFFDLMEAYANKGERDIDQDWLNYITDGTAGSSALVNGDDLSAYEKVTLEGTEANFWMLVKKFQSYTNGIVLWDEDVPATANVASTIAGAEDLLPVRYGTNGNDLCSKLMDGAHGDWTVVRTLVDLFDGETIPTFASSVPGTARAVDNSVDSTGSVKNDPYIWAMKHYLEEGKTNANLMTYSLDGGSAVKYPVKENHPMDAEIVSTNIPATMQVGSIVPIKVKVKNTGGVDWVKGMTAEWPNPVRLNKVDETTYSQSDITKGVTGSSWEGWVEYHKTHFQLLSGTGMKDPAEAGGFENIPASPAGGKASRVELPAATAQGEEVTFSFYLMAPTTPGAYQLDLGMVQDTANGAFPSAGRFGEHYYVPIMVTEDEPLDLGSNIVADASSVKQLVAADATYEIVAGVEAWAGHLTTDGFATTGNVVLNLTNNGVTTWTPETVSVRYSFGGTTGTVALTETVEAGAMTSVTIPVTAPAEAGDAVFAAQLVHNEVGTFGKAYETVIDVLNVLDCEIVDFYIPESIVEGSKAAGWIMVRNTGALRWRRGNNMGVRFDAGTRYLSQPTDHDDETAGYAYNIETINSLDVLHGETFVFPFDIHSWTRYEGENTYLSAGGNASFNFRMNIGAFQNLAGGPIYFGEQKNGFEVPVVAAAEPYDQSSVTTVYYESTDDETIPLTENLFESVLVESTLPTSIVAGETAPFSLTFKNVGTLTWNSENNTVDESMVRVRLADKNRNVLISPDASGSTADSGWKNRIKLPKGTTVAQGELLIVEGYLVGEQDTTGNKDFADSAVGTQSATLSLMTEHTPDKDLAGSNWGNHEAVPFSVEVLAAEPEVNESYKHHYANTSAKSAVVTTTDTHASVLNITYPDVVQPGEIVDFAATIKNTGTYTIRQSMFGTGSLYVKKTHLAAMGVPYDSATDTYYYDAAMTSPVQYSQSIADVVLNTDGSTMWANFAYGTNYASGGTAIRLRLAGDVGFDDASFDYDAQLMPDKFLALCDISKGTNTQVALAGWWYDAETESFQRGRKEAGVVYDGAAYVDGNDGNVKFTMLDTVGAQASGKNLSFSGSLVAPSEPGEYTITVEVLRRNGKAVINEPVDITIIVAEPAFENKAAYIQQIGVPASAEAGSTVTGVVSALNSTASAWAKVAADGDDGVYVKYTYTDPADISKTVTAYARNTQNDTTADGTFSALSSFGLFNISMTMPGSAGSYPVSVQVVEKNGDTYTAISEELTSEIEVTGTLKMATVQVNDPDDCPVDVSNAAYYKDIYTDAVGAEGNSYGATLIDYTMPEFVEPGAKVPVSVTIKNTCYAPIMSSLTSMDNQRYAPVKFTGDVGFNRISSNPDVYMDTTSITSEGHLALADKFYVICANALTEYENGAEEFSITDSSVLKADGTPKKALTLHRTINETEVAGSNVPEFTELDLLYDKNVSGGENSSARLNSGAVYTYEGWLVAPTTKGTYEITFGSYNAQHKKYLFEPVTLTIHVSDNGSIPETELQNGEIEVQARSTYTAKTSLFNSALLNADYYIAHKAFFWDLSPEADITPLDDRNQPLGTDVATLRKLLYAQMEQAQANIDTTTDYLTSVEGSGIFTVGGFVPWVMKYNKYADEDSTLDAVGAEWSMIDLISEYGGQTDADAYGTIGLSNASLYQHLDLNVESNTNPTQAKSTFDPLVGDPNVVYDENTKYIVFYMGDWDGAAWAGNLIKAIWDDSERGTLPLAWAIGANLSDRIPQVYNYMYNTATANDYFVTGDNGTGYLNIQWLLNPRDENITEAQIAKNRASWISYNTEANTKFHLGISGFHITGTYGEIDDDVMKVYHELTPYGVADHLGANVGGKRYHHGVYTPKADEEHPNTLTPFTWATSLDRPVVYTTVDADGNETVVDDVTNVANRLKYVYTNHGAGNFLTARTVKATPSMINDLVEKYHSLYPSDNLTVVDPYTYYRLYKEANGTTMNEFPEIKLKARNLSFGDSIKMVMSYEFNNMDLSGVNWNEDAGIYMWNDAAEATEILVDRAVKTVGMEPNEQAGFEGQYVAQTEGFLAKDTANYKYVRAYITIGDETYYSAVDGYSPKLYANEKTDSDSPEMSALAVAMLNYAAEAQTYAGVARNADSALTTDEKALNFDEAVIKEAAAVDTTKIVTPSTPVSFGNVKRNLRMQDNFNLLFFWPFDLEAFAGATDYGVLFWDAAGEKYKNAQDLIKGTEDSIGTLQKTTINGVAHYGAEYTGIAARNIENTVYARAYFVDKNGVMHYSEPVSYSVHQYAANIIAKNANPTMVALAKRVVIYGEAAKAYAN